MSTLILQPYPVGAPICVHATMNQITFPTPEQEPVTVADVVRHLNWPTGTPSEADVPRWITTARVEIERQTNLALAIQQWDLLIDPWLGAPVSVPLPLMPVVSVDEVAITEDDATETILDPSEYFADTRRRPCRVIFPTWPTAGAQPLRIRFTAKTDAQAIPADLTHALLMIVADLAMHRGDEREQWDQRTIPQARALIERYVPPGVA